VDCGEQAEIAGRNPCLQTAKGLGFTLLPRVVIAGGSGALGLRIAANFAARGHEVVILARKIRDSIQFEQRLWDGCVVDASWGALIPNSILINLSGELVDKRPTRSNIELLKSSRVSPTKALAAAAETYGAPLIWLQMSTLAIYGDAGETVLDENSRTADGPEQMAGVAKAWETALKPLPECRIVFLRTGIVLDAGTPALNRLETITKMFLGGAVGTGRQWVSWIHIKDFIRALDFIVANQAISGVVHVTSPEPVRNHELMAALRKVLKMPWSPPTPEFAIRLGARFIFKTDPMLALSGRRALPAKLEAAGFQFDQPEIVGALKDLSR
jgi:uncharacterized protein (TIGR01777 family)